MGEFGLRLEMLPWILSMLVITSCVHEAGHAWAAWRLGDRSDLVRNRISPFTFRHISLPFTIILPTVMMLAAGMMLGGAKPVMVQTSIGARRMAVVALAGPVGNLFCGVLSILLVAGLVHGGWLIADTNFGFDNTYIFALQAILLNFMLAALNLLPIPPFDGSRILAMFLPEKWRQAFYSFTLPSILLLVVLFFLLYYAYRDDMMRITFEVLLEIHNTVLLVAKWLK